jgi:hypothetical protein
MNLHAPTDKEKACGNIDNIAIAIAGSCITRSIEQRHVGFFLKKDNNEIKFLHLGWHNHLTLEDYPENIYCYVTVSEAIDKENLEVFLDWLLGIWEQNESQIPYSVIYNWEDSYFTEQVYSKTDLGSGLTCATFILECFKTYGLEILDFKSWPPRDDDAVWQQHMLQKLEQSGVDVHHTSAQNIQMAARFRPEEVAYAASNYDNFEAINFCDAQKNGKKLVSIMNEFGCL